MPRACRPAAVLAGLLIGMGPATMAHAQSCGVTPSVSGSAGFARYALNGGTLGATVGVEGAFGLGPLAIEAGYEKLLLEGDGSDPDVIRGAGVVPVVEFDGVQLCAAAHVGASRVSFSGESGAVLAGGIGVRLASAGGIRPYVEVRGLGARSVGTILGLPLEAAGISVGLETGAALDLGPVTARLTGTWDGFDDGLGTTPYPTNTAALSLHYRF